MRNQRLFVTLRGSKLFIHLARAISVACIGSGGFHFRTLQQFSYTYSTWTELTVNWLLGAIQSFCKRHYHVSAILHQEARHHKVEPIQERYAYRRHFSPYSPNTLRIQILCGARGKFNLKLVAEQQDPYRRSPRQKLNRKTYQKYHGRR